MRENDFQARYPSRTGVSYRLRARRGAALIYALVAVIIISLLVLGVGRLTVYHFNTEEKSRGYARAIYLAEAGANWQVNQMSRCLLPGSPSVAGWVSYDTVPNQSQPYAGTLDPNALSPFGDINVNGTVKVWVSNPSESGDWAPPGDFRLRAIGTDPNTGIKRGVFFVGRGTGLADRFALFGMNQIKFTADASGVTTLAHGNIGSNGLVTKEGSPPVAGTDNPDDVFAGCHLGGNDASILSGAWINGWDIPRHPDPIRWPTIDGVFSYIYKGASVSTVASTLNDNADIQYRVKTEDATPENFEKWVKFDTPPTQLTDAEFAKSNFARKDGTVQRTIRIRVKKNSNKVLAFSNIQMGPNDILILDARYADMPGAIRILINNGSLPNDTVKITNLAYFETLDSLINLPLQNAPYIWYNNTDKPIEFAPNMTPVSSKPLYKDTTQKWQYILVPGLRGLAYGANNLSTNVNKAGSVIVKGSSTFDVVVNSAIANTIELKGKVTVRHPGTVEDPADPYRFVLFYRINQALDEATAPSLDSNGNPYWSEPYVNYGHWFE